VVGVRHVEFDDGRRCIGELAGRSLGERQPAAGPGEHDVGSLLLRQLRHAEGERRIGEDAGDHEAFAVEETHAVDVRPTHRSLDG
jgi:hypothetical protein